MTEPNQPANLSWEDCQVGLKKEFLVDLKLNDIDAFATLCGDLNPLHMSDSEAQDRGFDQRVAHGVLLSSYVSRLIGMELPGERSLILETQFQYRKPVYAPVQLKVWGEIVERSESTRTIELKVGIEVEAKKVMTGKVRVRIP